jgi:hypothetical protein
MKFFDGLSNEEIAESFGAGEAHSGPAVGLCQGLAVPPHQLGHLISKKFSFLLAQLVWVCRMRG